MSKTEVKKKTGAEEAAVQEASESKLKKLFTKYKEIILYIIFGVLTTLVNWAVYWVLIKIFGSAAESKTLLFTLFGKDITMELFYIFIANFVAWVAGVLFAFVTNKIWVFESKSWRFALVMRELWLFVLARLITGVLEWFGVPLLWAIGLDQPLFGADGFVAKLVVSVIVVILNYVFSKLIIFRRKNRTEEELDEEVRKIKEKKKAKKKKKKEKKQVKKEKKEQKKAEKESIEE